MRVTIGCLRVHIACRLNLGLISHGLSPSCFTTVDPVFQERLLHVNRWPSWLGYKQAGVSLTTLRTCRYSPSLAFCLQAHHLAYRSPYASIDRISVKTTSNVTSLCSTLDSSRAVMGDCRHRHQPGVHKHRSNDAKQCSTRRNSLFKLSV